MTVKFDIINESRISEYKHSPSVTQYKLVVGGVKGVDCGLCTWILLMLEFVVRDLGLALLAV